MIKNLILITSLVLGLHCYSIDIYVDQTATAGGNGLTWTTAFQDIESAVNIAVANDRILIAQGIYQPLNEIDILVPLTIAGGYPAGGGIQNINLHITQIQADLNPSNLIFRIFDIAANAPTSISGLRFVNCRRAIDASSDLVLNKVQFDQISDNAIRLGGTINRCDIFNSIFSNTTEDVIRGVSLSLQNFEISGSTFETGSESAIDLGDNTVNFSMRNCTVRNYNNSTRTIYLDTTNAIISGFTATDNISTSGALISLLDTDLTMDHSVFNNNSGEGDLCIQGRDSQLMLSNSEFTNNSSISTFASPVLSLRDVVLTATNCLFENNLAQGSQPDSVAEIRGDNLAPVVTFEGCRFINNVSTGSITTTLDISYGAYAVVRNCIFDGNSSDRFNGLRSVNAIGIELVNNIFKNHTSNASLIAFYDTTSGGYTASISGNLFYDNSNVELSLSRYDNLVMSNNQFIGDNIDVQMDRIPNAISSYDYYRGNSGGNPFISMNTIDVDFDHLLMISTSTNNSHRLIDSGNDTALDILNSTFSGSNIGATNVTLDFDDDLPSQLNNSIIWSGTSNLTQSGLVGTLGNLSIDHSLIKGENPAGVMNMNGTLAINTPEFVNPTSYDFRMQRCSPTVNQGSNSYNSSTTDYQGNTRIFEINIDLGAYELQEAFNNSCVPPPLPGCTSLIAPLNNATNVDLNSTISWLPVNDATGYILNVGTTPGGTNILNETLGNVTNYNLSNSLPDNTQIYVEIIPFNGSGNATACVAESFLTSTIPNCTSLINPINGATGVLVGTNIDWTAIPNTTGYIIELGNVAGSNDILSVVVGNVTTYNIPFDLPYDTEIFVRITPLNEIGIAVNCNDESFFTELSTTAPPCTTIIAPADGAVDVAITSDITWNAEATATGYFISIGTAPGLTDVLNNFDNGNSTTYNPPTDFLEGTTYYVTIIPYNAVGNATGCNEISFTTEIIPTAPPCTTIVAPADGAVDVAITSDITWNAEATATGYFISIGTAPGLTDVLNNFDNGNSTTYNPPSNFLEGTTYYVTITPYNAVGNATACVETSFTTEVIPTVPPCTTIVAPANGAIDVAISTDITWNAEATATGYFISIGTAPGLTDVLNNFDNGNSTTYNPPSNFLEGTTYYVTITPYNAVGNATACVETSFTTEIIPTAPPCTTIVAPADGAVDVAITSDITWNAEATATGYFISIGTAPGLTDVLNNFDNGNSTNYNPPTDFLEGTTYYVTITPYNAVGNATACTETSFTTEVIPTIPPCTTIIAPADGELAVELNSNINWYFSPGATGYMLSIGTTLGGTDLLANFDNGNNTVWSNTVEFPENTVIYVSITPYNGLGNALDCDDFSFTTIDVQLIIPQYLTPNQDGFNDLWLIEDPTNEVERISILDRFGKLLYQSNTAPHIWDGLFNNQPLPSNDYWYIIELVDGSIKKGHFSLIR